MDINDLILTIGHHPLVSWLIYSAIFLILEMMTMSGWLVWPAAAAAIVAVLSKVTTIDVTTQGAAFLGITSASALIGRAMTNVSSRRAAPASAPNDQEIRVVGLAGKATNTFRGGVGRVFVDGKEWSAELEGEGPVKSGDTVYVVRLVGGARLKVRLHRKPKD